MAGKVSFDDDDDDDIIADINIVPFVDIVLVVLIIFMVTSTAIVKASLQVDLPKAASGGDSVETTINIVMGRDAETDAEMLFVNGQESTRQALDTLVRSEVKINDKLQAVISADQSLAYGRVVEVIDLVKLAGVKSFALNIERKPLPKTDVVTQGAGIDEP